MPPKRSPQSTLTNKLTKAEGLLFLIATRLLTAFRYKEASPGGDFSHFLGNIKEEMKKIKDIFNKYDPTPPSIRHRYHSIIKTVALEWESAVEERRTFDLGKFTGKHIDKYCARTASDHPEWPAILYSMDLSKDAADQAPDLQWWIPRPDGEGEHASPPPPPPAHPPPLRRSARMTKGKALLPLHPLDIKIGDDQPRGTNRSAVHINEASNNGQGRVGVPPPRKVVTPAGGSTTRATFQSPRESRLEKRRRVDDSLKNTEATQVAGWVAVGEDRCNPCKLVGRETCIPERDAGMSCIFCTGQSWSCNPPDSWLEKVPHLKQARPKPHNDVPIEVGGSSKKAAKATHHITEVEMSQRQNGHQRGSEVAQALDLEDLLEDLDLEELVSQDPSTIGLDLSGKKQMVAKMKQMVAKMKQRSAKMKQDLAALELTLHNIKLMARALCSHHGITKLFCQIPDAKIEDSFSAISRTLCDVIVLLRAVCEHQGITIPLLSDLTATAASTSIHPVTPSLVTGSLVHNLAPQSDEISNVGTEDEEPSQVCPSLIPCFVESGFAISALIQEAASQTRGLKRPRPDELMDTNSTSGHIQVSPFHCLCTFPSQMRRQCESCSHKKVKCAQCKGKKPSNQGARYQDSNHPYEHSTPAPARGPLKGTPAGRESTAQSSRFALSITDPDDLLSINLPGIDPAITTLCWRMELVRARAACEVANANKEFVEEKYEQSLEQAAALGQSTAGEPRAKRGKTNTSRKGKR
ncbi:hypothetical protein EDB85DRAFT_1961685 [Lactarius pseudohatsudake]|nr:hypothetical protein EDB85DRAFT_1961685 [Lactarius pseudohatsudake]